VPDDADFRRRLAADFSASTQPDVMLLNYRRSRPSPTKVHCGCWPYLQEHRSQGD